MAIIDIALVRDRLALINQTEVNSVLTSALVGAEQYAKSFLRTGLDELTYSDLFYVDSNVHQATDGMYALMLTNGFVRTDETVAIVNADTIATVDASTSATPVLLTQAEKGILFVDPDMVGKYLKVTYSAGFRKVAGVTVFAEVPDWLQEFLVAYTIKTLSMQQVNDKKDRLSSTYAFIDSHIAEVMTSHQRKNGFAIPALGR